jgi:hypothetical protein
MTTVGALIHLSAARRSPLTSAAAICLESSLDNSIAWNPQIRAAFVSRIARAAARLVRLHACIDGVEEMFEVSQWGSNQEVGRRASSGKARSDGRAAEPPAGR